jgi:hypothetical protein
MKLHAARTLGTSGEQIQLAQDKTGEFFQLFRDQRTEMDNDAAAHDVGDLVPAMLRRERRVPAKHGKPRHLDPPVSWSVTAQTDELNRPCSGRRRHPAGFIADGARPRHKLQKPGDASRGMSLLLQIHPITSTSCRRPAETENPDDVWIYTRGMRCLIGFS